MTPTNHGHGSAHGAPFDNPDVAHETSDVNVASILGFAAIIAITTVISALVVWGVFALLERQAEARDPKLSPLAAPSVEMPKTTTASPYFGSAPKPQLLTNEPALLRAQHAAEDRKLHTYGWVDQQAGIAQIPIDQAKKLLVERGLPAREGGSDAAEGTHAPALGEASGGERIPTGAAAAAPAPAAPAAPEPTAPAGGHKEGSGS